MVFPTLSLRLESLAILKTVRQSCGAVSFMWQRVLQLLEEEQSWVQIVIIFR